MDILNSLFDNFMEGLLNVLPLSPFTKFLEAFSDIPYLGWLNWFIPFRAMSVVFTGWLAVITAFYTYSIIMRWLKIIGD